MVALRGGALLPLILVAALLTNIPYAMTIIRYLVVRRKLGHKEGAFGLGRFEPPVAIVALIWVFVTTFVVVVSSASVVPILVVVGVILAGGVYFAYQMIFKREVLEHEPGKADLFEHRPRAARNFAPLTAHQEQSDCGRSIIDVHRGRAHPPSAGNPLVAGSSPGRPSVWDQLGASSQN